jgi:hypothetical protein
VAAAISSSYHDQPEAGRASPKALGELLASGDHPGQFRQLRAHRQQQHVGCLRHRPRRRISLQTPDVRHQRQVRRTGRGAQQRQTVPGEQRDRRAGRLLRGRGGDHGKSAGQPGGVQREHRSIVPAARGGR